jgi:hypothetical protein
MKRNLVVFVVLMQACLYAQDQSQLAADFAHEGADLRGSCSGSFLKAIGGCAQTLFTDHPLHIAAGSIAPQNGFGLGPAFVAHYTPNDRWRLSWNADAIGSFNGSWRAGVYMKAIYSGQPQIGIITDPKQQASIDLVHEYPVINVYAQSISLNNIDYYGLGNSTSREAESVFGMQQTIVGASATVPVPKLKSVSVFGEMNGRFVNLRSEHGGATPATDQLYTPVTAPGLANQPAFLQLGEGVRIYPSFLSNHVQLDYKATFQEFIGSGNSFNRFTADIAHHFPIYHGQLSFRPRSFNGPDQCAADLGAPCPPAPKSSDRWGEFGLRLVLSESFVSAANTIPFYFQPTLGGSDLNGEQLLPSYRDFRFRAPNILLFRASFEHSIWGPLGVMFMADEGKAALTHSELDFTHLKHSFGAGLTLRAGGFPVVSFLFAWGGREGTHTIANVNTSLLGGSSRPSLY